MIDTKSKKKRASIWGPRGSVPREPRDVIQEADDCLSDLNDRVPIDYESLKILRDSYITAGRSYYSLAALTRRGGLDEHARQAGLSRLFKMRSLLEFKILEDMRMNQHLLPVLREATKESFFGRSKKQGVSVRYALASCVPTARCGGLCYAHDGRDRELAHIYRGVLNHFVGLEYEGGSHERRGEIIDLLSKSINGAVKAALLDQQEAASAGYKRLPRIRFSHVGEIASTPDFANALAREIKKRDPRVQCVIYTRHPKASLLDTQLLVVNFTLEGAGDVRKKYVPTGSRIVNSAWDGQVYDGAEVNFLEHHVEKAAVSNGDGSICPVTADHKQKPSCDLARCQKCFVPTKCK